MDFEKLAVEILRRNLVVAIPLSVLVLKLVVRYVAREERKEIFRSLLSFPYDIVFVGVGLVLCGLARLIPQFTARYSSDTETDLAGVILLVGLTLVAVILSYLTRAARVLWEKLYAASQHVHRRMEQLEFEWKSADENVALRFLWMLGYWVILAAIVFSEVLLSVLSLGYVLYVIQ